MVKLNKIYTKFGDLGKTMLVGGKNVKKTDLRVEVYGTIDELNSVLGITRTYIENDRLNPNSKLGPLVKKLQQRLFDLGSEIASPAGENPYNLPFIADKDITFLENKIDELNSLLSELKSFVLPGGNQINATLHLARTIARRAERQAWKLKEKEPLSDKALIYLNRLSDLFFVMARYSSLETNDKEYLWEPWVD